MQLIAQPAVNSQPDVTGGWLGKTAAGRAVRHNLAYIHTYICYQCIHTHPSSLPSSFELWGFSVAYPCSPGAFQLLF
jgi:hypothetical protein